MTWYPTFLVEEYGFGLPDLATIAAIPLVLGLVATLVGGWFTDERVAGRYPAAPITPNWDWARLRRADGAVQLR